MLFNLDYMLNQFQVTGVLRHHNREKIGNYSFCKWLGNPNNLLCENCIYLGYASQLPKELPRRNVALILINDTEIDFSSWGLDVAELSEDNDILSLCLLIKESFFNAYETSKVSKMLIERMMKISSVQEILDIIEDIMGNPVFLNLSLMGKRLYYSGDERVNAQVKLLTQLKQKKQEKRIRESVQKIWEAPFPTITEDGFCFQGHRRMQTAVYKGVGNGNAIGVLTVFELDHTFTEHDKTFLSFMAHLISTKAGEPGFENQLMSWQYEQVLNDLIRGVTVEQDSSWLNSLFGSRYRNFRVALIDVKNLSNFQVDSLRYTLIRCCHFSTSLMRGSYLVYIANPDEEEQKSIFEAIHELSQNYRLSVGISEQFTNFFGLKKYYTQAKRSREFGTKGKDDTGVFFFDRLRAEILVEDLSMMESSELFSSEAYDILLAHDMQQGSEYCKTLETYILCGMDNAETMKRLNVHRNTLTYRLNKIEQMCGHSLKDGHFLVSMYFSAIINRNNERKIHAEKQ